MSGSLLTIGECMAEVTADSDGQISCAYAGDMFNAAVYAKRTAPNIDVGFWTGLGTDEGSLNIRRACQRESIDTSWIVDVPEKKAGRYWIDLDANGERQFRYDRADSSARQLLARSAPAQLARVRAIDTILLSGVTLAILPDTDRHTLLTLLAGRTSDRPQLAFDMNARPALWSDIAVARAAYHQMLDISDILFASIEDIHQLYQITPDQFRNTLSPKVSELVLKLGTDGDSAFTASETISAPFVPVDTVIDTTGAGDAFAGTYLAARQSGAPIQDALEKAQAMARVVIKYNGAIIPRTPVQ